ncbi:MAG TPA: HAMP domain-containing sensor histidine kinase [Anaeromyxobacteraceae bacterium]|nr:HAMP domain-containing sensor histidine kinase [Anaeromyxobacteraceae bacterium]
MPVAVMRGRRSILEWLNSAYQALAPERRMLGRSALLVWPERGDDDVNAVRSVFETGEPVVVKNRRFVLGRGAARVERYFTLSYSLAPQLGPGRILAVGQETTAAMLAARRARTALQALEVSHERLVAEAADRERLVDVLSHDLRTPLSAIALAAGLLRSHGCDEKQAGYLDRIATSTERMQRMITDLVHLSSLHAPAANAERCRLDEVARRAVAEVLDAYPGREIDVVADGAVEGAWDCGRLQQVVTNLLVNAVQHAPPPARIAVRASARERVAELAVANDGPPIPQELLPHVFEPFRHGGANGSTGLGLFIVREIVQAHGGSVDVVSDPQSTTFTVRLPREVALAR